MPAKSLVALAQREAIKNIGQIDNLGYAPYSLVRPILLKVPRAEQLLRIEENSPHLTEDTAEVWKYMIKRDFARASEKKGYVPKNPLSWGKVYIKYQREREEENAAAEALLRNEMNALRQERASKETRVLRPGEVPYEFRKATAVGAFTRFGGAPSGAPRSQSNLTWGGGARTKNVMKKVKREVAELSRRNVISGQLAARRGQISQAPKTMLNDHRISKNPDLPADKSIVAPRPPGSILAKGRTDMESRLLRAKQQAARSGSGAGASDPSSSSRLSKPPPPKRPQVELADDDLEIDDDALFGITEPAAKPSKSASAPSRKPQPPARGGLSPGFLDDESYENDEDLFGEKAESALSKRPASRAPPPRVAAGSPPTASRKRPSGGDIFMRSAKKAR
ncbi:hypothetical protein RB597_000843 [Gaeumannomyces tritici]